MQQSNAVASTAVAAYIAKQLELEPGTDSINVHHAVTQAAYAVAPKKSDQRYSFVRVTYNILDTEHGITL